MKKAAAYLALAVLILSACNNNGLTPLAPFVNDDTVRLEIDGVRVFEYSDNTCQLAFNSSRNEFRVHTDTMLDYFIVKLDAVPRSPSTKVKADISWSTDYGVRTRENITLDTKRVRGDVIWLCDESQHNAIVLRILE